VLEPALCGDNQFYFNRLAGLRRLFVAHQQAKYQVIQHATQGCGFQSAGTRVKTTNGSHWRVHGPLQTWALQSVPPDRQRVGAHSHAVHRRRPATKAPYIGGHTTAHAEWTLGLSCAPFRCNNPNNSVPTESFPAAVQCTAVGWHSRRR
jgi:hypothetical protein